MASNLTTWLTSWRTLSNDQQTRQPTVGKTSVKDARYEQYCEAMRDETLPLAWLDLDRLDANARHILDRVQHKPVRIVTKSIRSVGVLRHLLVRHDRFRGLMCFHPGEAAWLAQQGFDDLLVAYPSMQIAELDRAIAQTAAGKQLVLMVDCLDHIQVIARLAEARQVVQPLCLDVDMSTGFPGLWFGVRRSPVRTPADALALYQQIKAMPHVELVGVMGYEAQIAGVADLLPGKTLQNQALPHLKRLSIRRLTRRRGQVVDSLRQAGAPLRFVNGGGTGSMTSTSADASVTEVAVGSGFFCPTLFDYYQDLNLEPAAGFALEISRRAAPDIVTCSGGGYIASGEVGLEKQPQCYLPDRLHLDAQEGAGEVQTPLHESADWSVAKPALGAPVFFRHAKAGELCERFQKLTLLQNGRVIGVHTTYRGDGQCFV